MEFRIRLAEKVIGITSLYPAIYDMCRDYLTEAAADFEIAVTPEDIRYEREKSAREDVRRGRKAESFSEPYLETLAVYRKIAERLPEDGIVLFHGSCLSVDGVGYLFTARSGAGKSTHARLWRQLLGERAVMVNDDKPLLKISENRVLAFGTPWDGKHRLSRNMSVPLKAICSLSQSPENHLVRVESAALLPMLLQQVYRPRDREAMAKTLLLIDRLAAAVELYQLGCNMELEAARLSYEGMKR